MLENSPKNIIFARNMPIYWHIWLKNDGNHSYLGEKQTFRAQKDGCRYVKNLSDLAEIEGFRGNYAPN